MNLFIFTLHFSKVTLQATLSGADTHKKAGLIFDCLLLLFAFLEKYMEPKYHNTNEFRVIHLNCVARQ